MSKTLMPSRPARRSAPRPKLDPRFAILLSLPLRELKAIKRREDKASRAFLKSWNVRRSAKFESEEICRPPLRLTAGIYIPDRRKGGKAGGDGGPHVDIREPYFSVFIDCEASIDDLEAAGVRVRCRSGDIVTAFLPRSVIRRLERSQAVRYIELASAVYPGLDEAVPYAGIDTLHLATPPVNGAGVVVGVIDQVLDFHHPDFRNPDGSSRVLAIWDQRLTPQGGETSPASGYGVEYRASEIDAELSRPAGTPPYQTVRHGGGATYAHGTQVSSIAVGNGLAESPPRFIGAAPGAALVFVEVSGLPDSSLAADGFEYVYSRAAELGQPCVVNMSLNGGLGPRDGSSLIERFVDEFLVESGRAATLIMGNQGNKSLHAHGNIAQDGVETLVLRDSSADGDGTHQANIWYDGHDRFDLAITTPGGLRLSAISAGAGTSSILANGVLITVDSKLADPRNGDNVIEIVISSSPYGGSVTGDWQIALTGSNVINGHFDVWMSRWSEGEAEWLAPHVDNDAETLSLPSASRRAIVVGNHRKTVPPPPTLQTSSGRGPTRDGRVKPDVAAPGTAIIAATARDMNLANPGPFYGGSVLGTSFAAPLVGGACALLFQCRGAEATCADLKQIIQDTAGTGAEGGPVPNALFGWGYLRMAQACAAPPRDVDMWMRDHDADAGLEPSVGVFWACPDIEILDAAGNPAPNPLHDATARFTTIVRVTVRNRGTQTARNTEVFLYWADPATSIPYPTEWHAEGIFTGGPAFGEQGNKQVIAALPPGQSVAIDFAWAPPAPGSNLRGDDHFCLLARIENEADPSDVGAGGFVSIKDSNNLGLRNVHVLPNANGGDAVSAFYIVGTTDDDSLTVTSLLAGGEVTLNLPTAALPWRDLAFIEKHGMRRAYGSGKDVDPLAGERRTLRGSEIEQRTGIRGAERVDLERGTASVRLGRAGRLLIPQLRLAVGARLPASIAVKGIQTEGERRFIHVGQRSGGRDVGGVSVELRKGLKHREATDGGRPHGR